MFFAKYMFVTKGKLAKIWLAATYRNSKRLQKKEIEKINIEDSCQDITAPLAPLALRVSGQLLVGVARIYQRKVEFLFLDCNDAVASMKVDVKDLKRAAVDLPPEAEGDFDPTLLSNAAQLGASSEFELIPALTLADMEKITDDVDMDQHMARGAEITLPDIDDLPRTPLSQSSRRGRRKAFQDDEKMATMDDLLSQIDLELPPSPQSARSQRSARRSSRNSDAASQLDPLNDPLNEIPQKDDDAKSTTSSHVSSPGRARGSRRSAAAVTPITPGIDDSTVDTPFKEKEAPDTGASKVDMPDIDDLMNDPLMGPGADVPFPPLEDGASVAAEKEDGAEKDGGAEEKKEDAEKPDEAKEEAAPAAPAPEPEQKKADVDEDVNQRPRKRARRGGAGARGSRSTRMDAATEISRSQMKRHLADASDLLLDQRPRVSFKRRRRDEKYESARDIDSLFKTPDFGEEMAPDIVRFYQLAQRAVGHQPAVDEKDEKAGAEVPDVDMEKADGEEKRDVDDAKSAISGVTGVSSVVPPSDLDGGLGDLPPAPFEVPHQPGFDEPGVGVLDDPGHIQVPGSQLHPDDVIDFGPEPILRDDGVDGFFGANPGDKPLKTTSSGWSRRTQKMHQVLKNQGADELELSSLIEGNKRMTVAGIFHELLVLKTNGYIDTIQKKPFGEIKIRLEHKMDAPLPDEDEEEEDAHVSNGAIAA